jgi:hypothetical protein
MAIFNNNDSRKTNEQLRSIIGPKKDPKPLDKSVKENKEKTLPIRGQ